MKSLFSVEGKVVALTGGNGFLGQQYADALMKGGAMGRIWDKANHCPVDITDCAQVDAAVKSLIETHDRIDVLIHNAAYNPSPGAGSRDHWAPYEAFPMDAWEKELKLNLTAAQVVTQAVAPVMMKQKSGSIIFVASDLAFIGPTNSIYEPGNFKDIAYITSKAGILGLMRSWAAYLGPYGVRANALVPGGMLRDHSEEFAKKNGALNMLGRMAKPGEFDGAVLFLASDASSFVTGSCLVVDGGRTAW